jgi:hypothetical protein
MQPQGVRQPAADEVDILLRGRDATFRFLLKGVLPIGSASNRLPLYEYIDTNIGQQAPLGALGVGSSVGRWVTATEPRDRNIPVSTLAAPCYPGLSDARKARRQGAGGRKKRPKRSQFTPCFQHRWGNQSPWVRWRGPRGPVQSSRSIRFPRGFGSGDLAATSRDPPGAETAPKRKL